VTPSDPALLAFTGGVLMTIVIVAGLVPARRAIRSAAEPGRR
jgi:hypothetical protein